MPQKSVRCSLLFKIIVIAHKPFFHEKLKINGKYNKNHHQCRILGRDLLSFSNLEVLKKYMQKLLTKTCPCFLDRN